VTEYTQIVRTNNDTWTAWSNTLILNFVFRIYVCQSRTQTIKIHA